MDLLEQARSDGLDAVGYRRARHVVSENDRVRKVVAALASGDLATVGLLFAESHESLRDDYEVTVPELDAMVRAANSAPGCIGARMTGAGFGGCCVALIDAGSFQDFKDAASSSYDMYGFVAPDIFRVSAAAGASCENY
jgi:galactokinase